VPTYLSGEVMRTTNTENLQLIEQLPSVFEIQLTLLEQWCNNNGWTQLHLSSDYKFSAFPPGGLCSSPLPKAAFTQVKKLDDIFQELRELQGVKTLKQETRKFTLISSVACTCIVGLRMPLRAAIDTSNPPAIVYTLFDFSVVLFLMIPIISGSVALYGWQKHRQLRCRLAKNITTDSLVNLKNIEEGSLMRVINSSTTLTKE